MGKNKNSAREADAEAKVTTELLGATERVLADIVQLYETGLLDTPGAKLGLRQIAGSPQLQLPIRRPRKRVTVMLVGNHSAGKSSFINWYIKENIQKTGVAIETRGFTFLTHGKRRETLTGDATLRYFDFLSSPSPDGAPPFSSFPGIVPNLCTEITTSKERSFPCVDLIDTPGLVDGSMQYPFPVEDAIVWLADHVDLILVLLDPIGQATCKRTMQVVERLNNGPHLEKILYAMSKADVVEKEQDRQRVLIQITQNLATRIRNSHAFDLPTFYLPPESGDPPPIPNAIERVCADIDKSVAMTVQKSLRLLKEDGDRILARCDQVVAEDKLRRRQNRQRTLQGVFFYTLAGVCGVMLAMLFAALLSPAVCTVADAGDVCRRHGVVRYLVRASPVVKEHWTLLTGVLAFPMAVLLVCGKLAWHTKPVLSNRDYKAVETYRTVTREILAQEESLYERYFDTLSIAEQR